MNARDAIVKARAAQGQRRHVELAAAADAPHAEQAVAIEADRLAEVAEVVHDHVVGEVIVTGGTAVCVVNTVLAAAASSAAAKDMFWPTRLRMRSSTRNAA